MLAPAAGELVAEIVSGAPRILTTAELRRLSFRTVADLETGSAPPVAGHRKGYDLCDWFVDLRTAGLTDGQADAVLGAVIESILINDDFWSRGGGPDPECQPMRTDEELRAAVDNAPRVDLSQAAGARGDRPKPPNSWFRGSIIMPENVEFLWRDRFVAGRINIIAGMGDVGKDVLCCTIAACVTTGRDWPDGAPGGEPGIVGVISPEDDPADTIVPRLLAAGADMDRIRIWCGQTKPTPDDLAGLKLKLLIVSPLISLMGGTKDMNREQDARDFLELLQGGLKEQGCTVVGTAHLSKKSDLPVVQRILGASGIANFVRSNWAVQRDDEDKTQRLFLRLKSNLSPDAAEGLKFTIRHIGPWQQSIVCCWCGTTDKTPDAVMNGKSWKQAAGGWLEGFLREHGECEWDFIAAAAVSNGYGVEAVKKAGHRNNRITKTRRGFPSTSYWRLDE